MEKNTSGVSEPSQTRFPDAPWRKKTCAAGEQPHGDTSVNATPTLKKLPVPPPPPGCSSTSQTRPVMTPPPAPLDEVTSTSSSMCAPVCSRYRGLPVPPPDPKTLALLAAAPSSSQKRKDRAESSSGGRSITQIKKNRGKLAAARSSRQESKDRADIWRGARTKTQQRRDRGKQTRIKKYNKLKEAGHDVPTTGAASMRREQRKKAKVKYLAAAVHGGSMHGWHADNTHAGMTQRTIRAPPKNSKYRGG